MPPKKSKETSREFVHLEVNPDHLVVEVSLSVRDAMEGIIWLLGGLEGVSSGSSHNRLMLFKDNKTLELRVR